MNKIHRVLWSKKINNWVVASEHATSSKSKSRTSTAGTVLLGSLIPLLSTMAHAAGVCGAATAGSSVICDGSTTGTVSYPNLNIDLLIDGQTNGAVSLSGVQLQSGWIASPNNYDLSLTTQGVVNISAVEQNTSNSMLISMSKTGGAGDLNLSIGKDSHLSQTASSNPVYYDSTGVYVYNYNYDATSENSNTNVFLEKGSTIDIRASGYQASGINVVHNTKGNLSFVNNADIHVTSNNASYASVYGIQINGSKDHGTIENHGNIVLKNEQSDAYIYASGIKVSLSPDYTSTASADVTLINTGNIAGDYRIPNNGNYIGIDAFYSGKNSPGDSFKVENSGSISKVNYGIFANVQGGYDYDNDYAPIGMKGEVIHTGSIEARDIGILLGGGNFEDLTVKTSGKIVVCSNDDADGCYTPASSGGVAVAAKGIYITSTSGGVVATANVIVDLDSEIENLGASAQSAAIAIDSTQQADITVSGKLRSSQGAGISLTESERQYISLGPSGAPPFVLEAGQSAFNVELKPGAEVVGGALSAGIKSKGGNSLNIVIEDGATLEALSDFAIDAQKTIVPSFSYWEDTSSG